MKQINKEQTRYSQLYAILRRHKLDKADVLADFDSTKESLTELSDEELQELVTRLTETYGNSLPANFKPKPGDAMRKKIITMARQMRWVKLKNGVFVADMARIDSWCLHYGKFKKKLNDHCPETELPLLVTIFQEVLKTYFAGLQK